MPYFTGLNRIDSLLDSLQPHWNGTGVFNQAAVVSFSFAQFEIPGGEGGQQTQFTTTQKIAARLALQEWANVANITFNEVTDTGVFTGDSISRGDINFTPLVDLATAGPVIEFLKSRGVTLASDRSKIFATNNPAFDDWRNIPGGPAPVISKGHNAAILFINFRPSGH